MRRILPAFCILAFCTLLAQGCAGVDSRRDVHAVAVWNLDNLSVDDRSRPYLGELLSSEVMETVRYRGTKVVEREELLSVMEELNLGSSSLADESTRLKVGRMLGAGEMVFGGYMAAGRIMRIDLRRVDVETGRIIDTASSTAKSKDLTEWMKAARTAAGELYPSQVTNMP